MVGIFSLDAKGKKTFSPLGLFGVMVPSTAGWFRGHPQPRSQRKPTGGILHGEALGSIGPWCQDIGTDERRASGARVLTAWFREKRGEWAQMGVSV